MTGLKYNTSYYYYVSKYLNDVLGSSSSIYEAKTMQGSTAGKPGNLRFEISNHESITVRWDAPSSDGNMPITGYTVYFKPKASADSYGELKSAGLLIHVTGLNAAT